MFFKPQPIVSCFKDFEQAVWIILRVSISQIQDHTCVEYCVLHLRFSSNLRIEVKIYQFFEISIGYLSNKVISTIKNNMNQ